MPVSRDLNALKCVYCSGACNRCPHSLDWGSNGFIGYAVCNAIAIYDPKFTKNAGTVTEVLVHHKARVNCVRWIKNIDDPNNLELLSASADKTAVIWNRKSSNDVFQPVCILGQHDGAVTVADALYLPLGGDNSSSKTLLATSSTDSKVRIWERLSSNLDCIQEVDLGRGFALDVRLCLLPETGTPLLVLAGDDSKIHLYVQDDSKQFRHAQMLIGHEDWVRCVSIAFVESKMLVAACSQDQFIRIWQVSHRPPGTEVSESVVDPDKGIKMKEELFHVKMGDGRKAMFAVSLDTVLAGHENWVYSVQWQPILLDGELIQHHRLLSASMDKTMIIWELDGETGMWLEKVRVGEVGGNTLGFYGGVFSPDGKSILGHGYQGALHLWTYDTQEDAWKPGVITSGHFGEVLDVDWDPEGEFLLSCSVDQTTRVHAPWVCNVGEPISWHEIARPQVHGYDMSCLAMVSRYRFVSGAEEKVLRAFEAPRNFVENFGNICKLDTEADLEKLGQTTLPEGASVASLGLSNKAVFEEDLKNMKPSNHPKDQYPEAYFVPTVITSPPTEEMLLQNTLWPEVKKLYGHGYEVYCVASNHAGTIVASTCKASKPEHAAIILWSTSTWSQIGQIQAHSLTVTQLAFSPDDKYLLSVSRDRTWSLSCLDNQSYHLVASSNKTTGIHTRIIWACSWSPDIQYFVTVSRDKKAVVWGKQAINDFKAVSSVLELDDSITAVDFAPVITPSGKYVLAFGLENGDIMIYCWLPNGVTDWYLQYRVPPYNCHHLTVKKLKFCSRRGEAGYRHKGESSTVIQLASCGSDHQVRVFNLDIKGL